MFDWIGITLLSAFFGSLRSILNKDYFNKTKIKTDGLEVLLSNFIFILLAMVLLFPNKIIFDNLNSLIYLYTLKVLTYLISSLQFLSLLKKYEISKVMPILNLSPIFLLFLSVVFLNEDSSLIQIIGIFIIIISTYFLEININFHERKRPFRDFHKFFFEKNLIKIGTVFSICFLISITAISDKLILKKVNPITDLFFTSVFSIIFLVIYFLFRKNLIEKTILSFKPELIILSLFTIISWYLIMFAISLPGTYVSLIIPIRRLQTLFSAILGGFIFREEHLIKKTLLIILALFGVYLIAI